MRGACLPKANDVLTLASRKRGASIRPLGMMWLVSKRCDNGWQPFGAGECSLTSERWLSASPCAIYYAAKTKKTIYRCRI